MQKEIKALEIKITPVAEKAQSVVITNQSEMTKATELLSRLNGYNDSVVERKELITKPLNAALKAARAEFAPVEKILTTGISALRLAMGQFQTAEMKRIKEEEAKIAAQIGTGKGKISVEKAVAKMTDIDGVPSSVTTKSGMVKFRTDKVLKVLDYAKIPRNFLVPDEKLIKQALLDGKKVEGCVLEEVQTAVNYR